MNQSKLPYRPLLQPDESPGSLLIRATEGNGYESVLQMLSACRFATSGKSGLRTTYVNPERYASLLQAIGLNTEFASAAYRRSKPTMVSPRLLMDVPVPEVLFREDTEAFCPQCLAEHPYWRRLWSLRLYVVCHLHGTQLLSQCPGCRRAPDINRSRLYRCDCGSDWRDAEAIKDDAEPSRWLYMQITRKSTSLLLDCFKFWLALQEFDSRESTPEQEQWRLRVMIAWIYGHDISHQEVMRITINNTVTRHPRVQLLSFLKKEKKLHKFANQILKEIGKTTPTNKATNRHYASTKDACHILGINHHQLKTFIAKGLLKPRPQDKKSSPYFLVADLEKILIALQEDSNNHLDSEAHPWSPPTRKLVDLVMDILEGRAASAGYDLDKGLNHLSIRHLATPPSPKDLNIVDTAKILDVHPEIVRSLIKKNWLSATSTVISGHRMTVVTHSEVERFNSEYVSAGKLARSMGLSITTLSAKLENLGASPIAGPRIDGTIVYIFKRSTIDKIDLSSLRSIHTYETRAGRRQKFSPILEKHGATLSEAALQLNITTQQAARLVQKGILARELGIDRVVRVTEESLTALITLISSPENEPIDQVAAKFGYTTHLFRIYFIETGFVTTKDLYFWHLINKNESKKIKTLSQHFLSTKTASEAIGMHHSFLPNLERRGEIQSYPIGTRRKVKFYRRECIYRVAQKYGLKVNMLTKQISNTPQVQIEV